MIKVIILKIKNILRPYYYKVKIFYKKSKELALKIKNNEPLPLDESNTTYFGDRFATQHHVEFLESNLEDISY